MPTTKYAYLIVLFALAAAIVVYAKGLNGPFLFDDHIHITQNQWVMIESLEWADLVRAWNSSFSPFPTSRPLAQLTFGINHALAGLSPWAFKTTNLAIHLISGILVFVFSRLCLRAVAGGQASSSWDNICAAAVAAFWLLHPLNVSTVFYTVQRMAQLSTLSLLAALSCYFWGRIRIAEGRSGVFWILIAAPISMLGFLAKENAALLPLLLLVSELTVLRTLPTATKKTFVRGIWILFIAIPLLTSTIYFATHPGYFNFDARPFTLEERLLTQARILWLYLQWMFVPDISAFGLFHDDIVVSSNLTSPPSTLIAIVALLGSAVAALLLRRRLPIFAFAVLFYLASHALESSVFPLEMVFEHRNYLASIGPLIFLGYLITIVSERFNVRSLAVALGAMLLLSYTFVTHVRVDNWSTYKTFIMSSAENHPASARSNFMAAQMLISAVGNSENAAPELADAASSFLHNGLEVDARCINCMFGLVVLDLQQDIQPPRSVITQLSDALRIGYVGPTKVSVSQFSFLVKWQQSDGRKMPAEDLEAIFDAALENPAWNNTGRAGIEAAYREYYEFVAKDLPAALIHARAAVASWPDQWSYHMQLVRIMQKLGRPDDALAALEVAARLAGNDAQQLETAEVRKSIERR